MATANKDLEKKMASLELHSEMARETNHRVLREMKAKQDGLIGGQQRLVDRLVAGHKEIEQLKADHDKEIEALKDEIQALKEECNGLYKSLALVTIRKVKEEEGEL